MLIRWKSKDKSSSNSSSSSSKKKRKGREGGKQLHAIFMGRSSFQFLFENKFYASEWNFQWVFFWGFSNTNNFFLHYLNTIQSDQVKQQSNVCGGRRDQANTSHQKSNRINSITEKLWENHLRRLAPTHKFDELTSHCFRT